MTTAVNHCPCRGKCAVKHDLGFAALALSTDTAAVVRNFPNHIIRQCSQYQP